MLRVARTLTGSWAEAEDVVQESLLRAWRAADRFDGRHPRAWLLTIVRRTHLNMLRRSRPDPIGTGEDLQGHRLVFGSAHVVGVEEQVVERVLSLVPLWIGRSWVCGPGSGWFCCWSMSTGCPMPKPRPSWMCRLELSYRD